ncbi:hypothetical protein K435DRAFT_761949 [Dendrothele bispora CBS 962.96]|uniref:Carbohydrate esterase family 16 protein n=1 Tax=Dendrothele bispora (strain CBS 962.96) TaxID=1314807 RepID=A0A4S8LH48_DENBC|nr:hypothetical protein K435DRAFT_730891 [Dendrothele bispora CBS 962.96]THU88426.1 hypothetical protein K435DRAFT_761949 [Dendrothele bispora CBS 962.96]
MSKVLQVTSSWPGISGLKKLMIFGDSYSSVGYTAGRGSHPSASNPLGVPFPGRADSMWNEADTPNWVGHFITKYASPPRFDPSKQKQAEDFSNAPLLVYDFAIGGQTVNGVEGQIEDRFLPTIAKKPEWAPWTANESLFVIWIGINDCAYSKTHKDNIARLFGLQEKLYEAGARNFLFFDVPPIHRCPGVPAGRENAASESYLNWNTNLRSALDSFAGSHSDATVLLFSSFGVFSHLLDNPEEYGFKARELRQEYGGIWNDYLHPTSRVHDIVAARLTEFLKAVPTSGVEVAESNNG